MAVFGLRVLTQNGYKDFAELFGTCRYVGQVALGSAQTGSAVVPSIWTQGSGTYVLSGLTPPNMPNITFSGNTFSWTGNYSSNVRVLFFVDRDTTLPTGYGFFARNQSNQIVLDSNYKPLAVVRRGVSNSTASTSNGNRVHYIPNVPVGAIVFAEWSVGMYCAMFGGYEAGSAYQVIHSNPTISYIVAQADPPIPASDWGMQIFNANGERIYDTALETIEVMKAGINTINDQAAGIAIPSAVNFCFSSCAVMGIDSDPNRGPIGYQTRFFTSGCRRNSATSMGGAMCTFSETQAPNRQMTTIPAIGPVSHMLIAA